jgi:hypothetical protein
MAMTEEIDFEVDGVPFVLRVVAGPSGLRGQVFSGDEKVAGVHVYHTDDRQALLRQARSDPAVHRAAARLRG